MDGPVQPTRQGVTTAGSSSARDVRDDMNDGNTVIVP